jgi:hypothetical protein
MLKFYGIGDLEFFPWTNELYFPSQFMESAGVS